MTPAAGAAAAPIVREFAPAKVNLYLHVTGRRADGYHLLDSLVCFPALGDDVEVAPGDGLSLAVDGPFAADVPAGDGNILCGAARALAAEAGIRPDAAIRLTKRLPVASGIGGGSADAAAALRALCRLWDVAPDPVMLAQVAVGLGADVPMCLAARPAFTGGIGEILDKAPPLPAATLLLVNPGVALPTPRVFRGREGPFSPPGRFEAAPASAEALAAVLAARRNDLTAAAVALCPAVGEVLQCLAAMPGALLARMSGSGATCFALFADATAAAAAAAGLALAHPGWWIAAAPIQGRA
jgi:4-diphosphocytidyl-2-C-methyl-D-erythritol kinase